MPKISLISFLELFVKQFLVAVFYCFISQLALRFFAGNGVVSMVYPPSGFALAILLIGGKRYFWSILLGAFLSNAMLGLPLITAICIGTGNALSALCGTWLLTRNEHLNFNLETLRDYLRLILLGGVISCGVAAFVGSSSLLSFGIIGTEKYSDNLIHWWMGDALGVLLTTPLILVLWQARQVRPSLERITESVFLIGLTFLSGQIIFLGWFHDSIGQVARGYWMFLFISWIAVKLRTRGTVIAAAIVAIQGLAGAANHIGFFADDIAKTNLANYWFYITILSLVGMALATYVSERISAERELQQYRLHLEQLVYERTAELVKAKEAAESANIAKSTFIATMSHELRTPLNAILGFSELMSLDEFVTPTQKDTLNIINRSGVHLLKMINDVLDISKIEAGRLELNSQPCDLIKLLQEVGNMIHVRATQSQLNFVLNISPDTTRYVCLDGNKLQQVLINLLGNAIKFTPQNGKVTLRVRSKILLNQAEILFIDVIDSGIGVSESDQEKLFKPFIQVEQENSTVKGTGLGLAISKSLVELMGGQISLKSVLGKGSTFSIKLPIEKVEENAVTYNDYYPPVKCLAANQQEWRILVVDDNVDNRLLLVTMLVKAGFEVREAENGQEAVNLFLQWQPHFIWMDMRMPVMDGYEATKKIRQLPMGDKVKIVALTASAFKEQHNKIIASGCDAVLHKPFHIPEIFSELNQHLDVEFIYQDSTTKTPFSVLKITPKMLENLPLNLRQQLKEAALQLDVEEVDKVIINIRLIDSSVANGLDELLKKYEFEKIATLVENL